MPEPGVEALRAQRRLDDQLPSAEEPAMSAGGVSSLALPAASSPSPPAPSEGGLFGAETPPVATHAMKKAALERELTKRRNAYPRFVAAGKMSRSEASFQVWILERILLEGYRP